MKLNCIYISAYQDGNGVCSFFLNEEKCRRNVALDSKERV